MLYQHKIDGCLAETIGNGGIVAAHYRPLLDEAGVALRRLNSELDEGALPAFNAARATADLAALDDLAGGIREAFDDVLVLATGGSNLGGEALAALAPQAAPRLHFLDNLDPHTLESRLAGLDPARTACLAISKSGRTLEVLAQLLVCLDWARGALGEAVLRNHVVVITEPGENPLRRLAARFGFSVHDHDPRVGGRYSVLTLVGLVPALIAGLDAAAARDGAADVLDEALAADDVAEIAPACGAALAVAFLRHHKIATSVLMPYSDRLTALATWHRQLWAESLGKHGLGLTPVVALGPVDQHSQLQLYLDGPADKMFTLILSNVTGRGARIAPDLTGSNGLAHLAGRTVGDVMAASQRATAETFIARGRPTRLIGIERVDERTLGALFMHFMLETVLAARLLGVDPFDQPAVEEGKALARRYLEEMEV
jgi:glucose-6-phosphate isomerase